MEEKNRLVVADRGWAQTIPDWLKREVEKERLIERFTSVQGKDNGGKVGLAEAAVYLYTASLRSGLDYHHTQIYLYVTGKLIEHIGGVVPDVAKEVIEKGLDTDSQRLFNELRSELYRKRGGEIRHPLFDALKVLKKKYNPPTKIEPTPTREALKVEIPRGWRNHKTHREETQAVKKALKEAGIEAKVGHGTGTAWGWLEINLGPNPSGLEHQKMESTPTPWICSADCPACEYNEELRLHTIQIAKYVTGRHGDYDGEISVLTQ